MKATAGRFRRTVLYGLLCASGFGAAEPVSARSTLRILPLGDSITRGYYLTVAASGPQQGREIGRASGNGGGWRKPLQDRLRARGIAFDVVGDLSYHAFGQDGKVKPHFDPDHHGIEGEAADLKNDGLVDLLVSADPDTSGVALDPRRYESMIFLNIGLHGARENHWLRRRFPGVTNAQLVGARVDIFEPGTTVGLGTRGVYSHHSYKSSSALEVHLVLGGHEQVDVKVALLGGRIVD